LRRAWLSAAICPAEALTADRATPDRAGRRWRGVGVPRQNGGTGGKDVEFPAGVRQSTQRLSSVAKQAVASTTATAAPRVGSLFASCSTLDVSPPSAAKKSATSG